MGCFTYDKDNSNLILNSTYNNTGGIINYGSSAAARFDKVNISNKVVYLKSLNLNNKNYTCFYDSNSNFIINSCSLFNTGDLNSPISIPDNAVFIGISLNRNDNTPVFEICDIESSPIPSPVVLDHFYYLPENLLNQNYIYYFDGDKYIIQIDSTSCIDVFPHNDYLVSDVYTCDPVGSTIPFSSFSSSPSYRVDFPSILFIIFIFMFGIVFLLSVLCHSLFKGVFK